MHRGALQDALAAAGPLFVDGGFGPADLSIGLRNRSNGAGEFYEVINIGDAGHVVSRTQAVVECLAKTMIDALTSLDLWQIFPPRALHARIGLFLKNNNVISF
jgi:hypothetical protein